MTLKRSIGYALLFTAMAMPEGLWAQADRPDEGLLEITPEVESSVDAGPSFFGRAPDRRRIIPVLGVMHPFERQFPELDWVRGGGVQFSTWFAAAFMNSYDKLSVMLGIERNWLDRRVGGFGFGVGYRAGALTGYDERLIKIAGDVPVLPFGGLLVWLDAGPLGLGAFYVYRAISIEGSIGF